MMTKNDQSVANLDRNERAKRLAALHIARANLRKFRRKQTEYFLEVVAEIHTLREAMKDYGEFDVTSWLKKNLAVSEREAEMASAIDASMLAEKQRFISLGTDPRTIYALSRCNTELRRKLIKLLESGETLGEAEIKRHRDDDLIRNATADQIARLRRHEVLKLAGKRAGATIVKRLQDESSKLVQLFDASIAADGRWVGFRGQDTISPSVRQVAKKAASVLSLYHQLFGHRQPDDAVDPEFAANEDFVAKISFDTARQTLQELTRGTRHFPIAANADLERTIRKHLEFLAGETPMAVSNEVAKGSYHRKWSGPTFVDIDAGVGGMALGLAAAGFRPVSIFARTTDAKDAIDANELLANVQEVRQNSFRTALEELKGSDPDLLTCGIPWHEYHHGDAIQAYKNALEAVVQLQPKAFIFESRSGKFDRERARSFEDRGYDVKWHSMDGSEFRLAQTKVRSVMIGSRNGHLNDFVMPTLRVRHAVYLGDVIGDLIGGHVWENPVSQDALKEYDALLDEKRSKLVKAQAPSFHSPTDFRCIQLWKDLGIDIKGFLADPPSPGELKRADGYHLNTAMVKRIQSFPDDWIVESASSSNAETVADAFPPVLAKMIGLALHSALLGIEFDYDRAMHRALVGVTDENPRRKPVWEIPHPRYAISSTNAAFATPTRSRWTVGN